MNDSLLLKESCKGLIEVIFSIIKPQSLDFYSKLSTNHVVKGGKNCTYFKFIFRRKSQTTQVQSSINTINHHAPKILGTVVGPQISLWIRENGREVLLFDEELGTLLCLANSQTEHWKSLISRSLNKAGNMTRIVEKER